MKKFDPPLVLTEAQRVEPRCPHASVCGGCRWQHVDYAHQLELKRRSIAEAFTRASIAVELPPVLPCPEPFYYRNRMDYVFGRNGELGLKPVGKWWETLDLSTCFLLSPQAPEILKRVRDWTRKSGLPFWNVKTHEGFFRYLVIREGKSTGERLIMLIVSDQYELTADQRSELLDLLSPFTTSILIGVNEKITDLSIPQRIEVLKGEAYLHEEVNGIRYRIQPASFFQTNTTMAAKLQDAVLEAAGDLEEKTLLDLYCGAGFLTLALSKKAKRVLGIELDSAAIDAANLNASLNGINGVEFIASKVESVDWKGEKPDVVVLDPPRAGLHPDVITALLQVRPERLIYVSCKYSKLIEELPKFLEYYALERIQALDLFPQTPHVEVVVSLKKL